MTEKNINEQLKAKIDEIDFDTKIAQVTEAAHKAFDQIREQAASLLSENRGKVDEIIDKATAAFDEKTEGKYHDKVAKAKASFASGLDKLSEEAPAKETDTGAGSGTDAAADVSGSSDTVWAQATDAGAEVGVDNPEIGEAGPDAATNVGDTAQS